MARAATDAAKAKITDAMADVFDQHLAIDIELQSQIGRLRQKVGTNMAQYEAQGGHADDIRIGRQLDKEGLELVQRINRVAGYMDLVTVDEKGQASFAAALAPDAKPQPTTQTQAGRAALARADTDGYNSGWAGGSVGDNPHPIGSEIWSIWDRGCRDGSDARTERQAAKERPQAPEQPLDTSPAPVGVAPAAKPPSKRKGAAAAEAKPLLPPDTVKWPGGGLIEQGGAPDAGSGLLGDFEAPALPN